MTDLHRDNPGSPAYPMPPGGHVPNLNLAGVDGWSVAGGASGSSILPPMPTPPLEPPRPMMPALQGSPEMGGIDPSVPYYDLNLAGVQGIPAPDSVTGSRGSAVITTPDFTAPDMAVPSIVPYDLTGPGVTAMPEFSADPAMPDLEDYSHPLGLEIQDNSVLAVDPQLGDLVQYETPSGLNITRDPLEPDPTVPDVQHPDLEQDVHMLTRPGDLADDALAMLHGTASYQQIADKSYPSAWLDQRGMNTTRARHLSLLDAGLDESTQRDR